MPYTYDMKFDDETIDNLSFSLGKLFQESSNPNSSYHINKKQYDNDLMCKAIENIPDELEEDEAKNNCEAWAKKVKAEYDRLFSELTIDEQNRINQKCKISEKKFRNVKLKS